MKGLVLRQETTTYPGLDGGLATCARCSADLEGDRAELESFARAHLRKYPSHEIEVIVPFQKRTRFFKSLPPSEVANAVAAARARRS